MPAELKHVDIMVYSSKTFVWQITIESRSEIMLVHCNQGALLSARARAKVVDPRNQDQRST